jgi:hypothetical protein
LDVQRGILPDQMVASFWMIGAASYQFKELFVRKKSPTSDGRALGKGEN